MSEAEFIQFKKLLKQAGYFITAPRKHIFELLQEHPALTLKQLIHLTKDHDQATVYRTVDLFEELGVINRLRLGWHTKIELSDLFQHHHHHLTCTQCGKVTDLEEDLEVEQSINKLAAKIHFKAIDHNLEIRGVCNSCQRG